MHLVLVFNNNVKYNTIICIIDQIKSVLNYLESSTEGENRNIIFSDRGAMRILNYVQSTQKVYITIKLLINENC